MNSVAPTSVSCPPRPHSPRAPSPTTRPLSAAAQASMLSGSWKLAPSFTRLHGLLGARPRLSCAASGGGRMTRGKVKWGQQLPTSARTTRHSWARAGAPGQAFSAASSGNLPFPRGPVSAPGGTDVPAPVPAPAAGPATVHPGSMVPPTPRGAVPNPPPEFTGDELHYVGAPGGWRLALWRYLPRTEPSTPSNGQPGSHPSASGGATESLPQGAAPKRKHPVLLLSGIATNAMGFDISPEVSLARHLRDQGFDTWVVEMRGAGLSYRVDEQGRQKEDLAGRGGIGYRTQQPAGMGATEGKDEQPAEKRLKTGAAPAGSSSAIPGDVLVGAAEEAGRAAAESMSQGPEPGQGAALDALAEEVSEKVSASAGTKTRGEETGNGSVAGGVPGGGGISGVPGRELESEERMLQSVERAERLRLEREVAGDLQRTARQLRARFDAASFASRGAPTEAGNAPGERPSSRSLNAQPAAVGGSEGGSGGGTQGWWEVRMSLESWLQGALGLLGGDGGVHQGSALGPEEKKALVAVVDAVEELLLACRLGEEEMLQDWGTVRAQAQGLLETLECAIFSLDTADAAGAAAAAAPSAGAGTLPAAEKPDLALLSLRSAVKQLLQQLQERESAVAAGKAGGVPPLSWYQRYTGLSFAGKVARFLVGVADPEGDKSADPGSTGRAREKSSTDSAPAPESTASAALATTSSEQGSGGVGGEVPSVGVAVSKTVGILRESVVEMASSSSGAASAAVVSKTVGRLKESVGEIAAAAAASSGRIMPLPTRTLSSVYASMVRTIAEAEATVRAVGKYDWDFDTYLLEDLPAVIDYVGAESSAPGGEVMAVGHSMGGILLYSRLAALGPDAKLKGVVTVASSLEYGVSNTSLKLLLPLATPARTLEWAAIPMPLLTRAALPLITQPPYTLAWIGLQMSARNAMDAEHFAQLMRHNFVTIPVRLLLQLESVFLKGGLRNRSGSIAYRKGLKDCRTPVLALAADADLICPPIAVTAKYMLFGAKPASSSDVAASEEQPHASNGAAGSGAAVPLTAEEESLRYGHYDLLAGHKAPKEVFPAITAFLVDCDTNDENGSTGQLNTNADSLTVAEGTRGSAASLDGEASPLEILQNSMSK